MTTTTPHRWHRAARSPRLAAALLVAWTVLCYAPALRGPLFFDDEHFITKNRLVHSLANAGRLYTTSVTEGAGIHGNFYRPNQQLLFALLYAAVGDRTPVPYHLLAVLLHAGNGLLLAAWFRALGVGAAAALAGAAVFLLHPVQTEAVCYVSGLADPLALAFMLGALLTLTRALSQPQGTLARRLPLVVALAALGLLSKESAVVILPLAALTLGATALAGGRRPPRAAWVGLGLLAALVAGYVALKLTVLDFTGEVGLTSEVNAYTASLALRGTTFVSVLWDYAVLLAYPRALNYEKPYRAYADLLSARGAFGVASLAAAGAALATARRHPRVALGVGVVVAALAPFTGVVPLNGMYLEHWLYVPLAGVALLAALALARWGRSRRAWALRALTALALAAASVRTSARAAEWADAGRFYRNELAVAGPSARVLNNLGMYYEDRQALPLATRYYRLAATQAGSAAQPQPHHNLARVLAAAGDLRGAEAELHAALRLDPGFVYSLEFLRDLYLHVGDERRAAATAAALAAVRSGQTYDYSGLETTLFGDTPP